MGYLQFIIDYYDRLPASTVFLHGYRESWHLHDHVPLLRRLKWGALPFANIRYSNGPQDRLPWRCGKHFNDSIYQRYTNRHYYDCNWVGNIVRPYNLEPRASAEVQELTQDEWYDSLEMFTVWNQTFAGELGPLPALIKAPCCAEFMVSRDRIQSHSRDFYIHLRDWILTTEVDAYRTGRVLEYTWHMIFGEPAALDPVQECALLQCDAAGLPDVHL
ncbi:hypothetical protein WJX73_000955 [Symbiochloris irregularis]|uniref:Uncharacterized protein n=1 Tax=Symbiochloris irregularis TaxID=706552 RepID=A0AAW1PHZ9_9CHLO